MSDAIGKHILLVDDSPVVADAVRDALEPFGFHVAWIEDGADVPKALERQMPDLAILDVMMPGVDGYEACRRLRADPKTTNLPVLMLTARAEEADKVVGLELGADEHSVATVEECRLLFDEAEVPQFRFTLDTGASAYDGGAKVGRQTAEEAGLDIYDIPAGELAGWKQALAPLHQQWIADMEAKGLPGQKIYDEAVRLAAQ